MSREIKHRRSLPAAGAKWQKRSSQRQKRMMSLSIKIISWPETLSKLEIGDAIPPELYEVVAEILVFVDDMDKMKAKLQQADMLS